MLRLFIVVLLVVTAQMLPAQGIEFFDGTWEEAVEYAKAEEKILFVDAYASWCGPCKRMAKNVFTKSKVGDFHNKHFVNVKLDYETVAADVFRKTHKVRAFPTLFYIDYTDEEVHVVVGAQTVDKLIAEGKKALDKLDRSGDYEAEYNKGNRDPELMYNYIKALNEADKPFLKIANEYLRNQENLASSDNVRIIFAATKEVDSRIFELFLKYKKEIQKQFDQEMIDEKIKSSCKETVRKAIEFEYPELMDQAFAVMKKELPFESLAFEDESKMAYAIEYRDAAQYLDAAKDYVYKVKKGNVQVMFNIAKDMEKNFSSDEAVMKEAENIYKKLYKKEDNFVNTISYANILYKNSNFKLARKIADLAMEKAENNKQKIAVKNLLDRIGAGL